MSTFDKWICPECETENEPEDEACSVCGYIKELAVEEAAPEEVRELSFGSSVSSVTFSVSTGEKAVTKADGSKTTLSASKDLTPVASESALDTTVSSVSTAAKSGGCLAAVLSVLTLGLSTVALLLALLF